MISVTATDLKRAVGNAVLAIGKRTTLPILECVLLSTEENELTVSGTDLEKRVIDSAPFKGDELEAVVQGRVFFSFIKTLKDRIDLEQDGTTLYLTCGNINATFPTYPPEEFPLIPQVEKEPIEIEVSLLVDAILSVSHAAATDEGRPVLTGVYWENQEGILSAAAADGFRLAVRTLESGVQEVFSSLLPANTLNILLRIAKKQKGNAKVWFGDIVTLFELPDGQQIYCQTIEGNFVNYKQIVPSEKRVSFMLDRAEFEDAIKQTMIVSDESRLFSIEQVQDGICIASDSQDVGEVRIKIQCENVPEFEPIALNGKFVLQALAAIGDDTIEVDFLINRPFVITPQEGGLTCVIMPMNLRK